VVAVARHEDHQQYVPRFSRDRQGTSLPSSIRVPQRQLLKVRVSFILIQSHCAVRRKACKIADKAFGDYRRIQKIQPDSDAVTMK